MAKKRTPPSPSGPRNRGAKHPPHPLEDIARWIKEMELPRGQWALFKRVWTGNSRAEANHAMCVYCQGGDSKAIKECQDRKCPLWRWRTNK
jgi:hypothetical protein